jgi:hypothetical protein
VQYYVSDYQDALFSHTKMLNDTERQFHVSPEHGSFIAYKFCIRQDIPWQDHKMCIPMLRLSRYGDGPHIHSE